MICRRDASVVATLIIASSRVTDGRALMLSTRSTFTSL
jgi:hypothetical protein